MNSKYSDLESKMKQMQQVVSNQTTLQTDIDNIVRTNIQNILPEIVEQQMKQFVVPLILKHLKSLDRQVKTEILPMIEENIEETVTKIIKSNGLSLEGNGQS